MPEEEEYSVATRGFWSGTISFGLVSVPVSLMPANRSNRTSLRMVTADGTPLTRRYFSTVDDRELESDDIVRGYEIEKDEFVVVEDDELEKLAPERTRDIDLRVFVKASDIDPKHFERAYYLTPAGNSTKAYRLLAKVMEETDRAGIATFVMRGKEYLIAILAENGILRAETLRFAAEVRGPEEIGLPEPVELGLREINEMAREIRKLEEKEMDPDELSERSAARLKAIVQAKVDSGSAVVRHDDEKDEVGQSKEVIDLVEMLQRSLKGGGGAKKSAAARSNGGSTAKLKELTRAELYEQAQERDIPGRSSMTKDELIKALAAKG